MMEIDIVGEDDVTRLIIERLLRDLRPDIVVKERLPARGGQLKVLAPKYNLLNSPVFLLTDLDDYQCPPSLIRDWFGSEPINSNLLFRIAQEEAETWLLADREGFSKWLGVSIDLIPAPNVIDRRKNIFEIICPLKPSLYMMREIASHSRRAILKDALTPKSGAKKGPGYNSVMTDFINNHWNVANAVQNSYSLQRAIARLTDFGNN